VVLNFFRRCVAVLLCSYVVAMWPQPVIAQETGDASAAPAGETAPDFVLRSISGDNIRLSEYQGQVVALGFWARWCGDCRQAMQALDGLYSKYQRAGLVLLGIDVDDSADQTRAMARSLGLTFPVLVDEEKTVSSLYKVKSMPLIILIDRAGQIRFKHRKYELGDQGQISEELRQLLNE